MENNTYHYDAFISYRHCDLDKFVAENLHKMLESYRMPADVAKKRPGMKNRIERVFRDKEELPLTSNLNDPIMTALHNSDWLIVICSPRLRESVWCKKEIETFIASHGREKVLAVLIEGEPEESFPEELLFKTETVTKPDGSTEEIKIPVEPLAADVRGKNKKEILKNMKAELLRILAAMFHMNYDDLRQRHKEQEHKRKMRYTTLGAFVCLLVAVVSVVIALQMHYKNQMIQGLSDHVYLQNESMKAEQARNLSEKALKYLKEGDRETAIQYAIWASTQYDSLSMPYTEEAQYALAESLGVYDTGEIFKAQYQYETMGVITHIDVARDKKTLMILDDSGTATLYDTEAREAILVLSDGEHFISADSGYAFLDNHRFAYLNASDSVIVYNIEERAVERELAGDYAALGLIADETGKYLAIRDLSAEYNVYNGETLEYIGKTPDFTDGIDYSFINEEGILAYSHFYQSNDDYCIYFVDCNTMQELSTLILENVTLEEIAVDGDVAYVFANRYSTVLVENECLVYGIDINTGQILWENRQQGYTGEMMVLPGCEEKKELLILTEQTAGMVDMETGKTRLQIPLDSCPVSAFKMAEANNFEFFCEDGSIIMLNEQTNYDLVLTSWFDCKTDNNKDYCLISNGIVTLPEQSNRIVIYEANCADGVEVSETKEIQPPVCYYGETAKEYARQYGLDQAEYVSTLFFDSNREVIFASYWNYEFVIYDTVYDTTYRDVFALDDVRDMMCGYLGTDADGNIYIQGEKGGYVLSSEMKPMMRIPHMVGVDLEQNKVYLQLFSSLYEAPIYSFMDLIQMAGPYMLSEDAAAEDVPSEG